MQQLRLTVFLVFISFVLVQPSARGEEFTYHYQKIIETGCGMELELTYVSGDLQITGNDYGKLIIEAVKKVNAVSEAEAEEIQAHIEIRVEQSKNKIAISTNYLWMRNRSRSFWNKVLGLGGSGSFGDVDWVISVPDSVEITIINTNGAIDASHIRGSLTVRSPASDIMLSNIEGPVSIEKSSGRTSGDLIFGDVEVRQPRGEIDLRWVEGDIKVKSSSAKINILQEYGAIDLTTSTGLVSIQTNLDSSEDFFVETESGNINLLIPESASGKLDIKSESGEIRTDMPIAIESLTRKQVVGKFGYGGVRISLSSISGDVTVAQF